VFSNQNLTSGSNNFLSDLITLFGEVLHKYRVKNHAIEISSFVYVTVFQFLTCDLRLISKEQV